MGLVELRENRNGGNQYCSNSMIGYDAVGVLTSIDNTQLGTAQRDTVNNLTRAMILHPIAAVLAFLACLISAGSGVIGSVLGSGIAFIACLVTLVIMAIDLAIFGVRTPQFFLNMFIRTTDALTYPGYKKSRQFRRQRKLRRILNRDVDVHCGGSFAVPRKYDCTVYLLFRSSCQGEEEKKEGLVPLTSLTEQSRTVQLPVDPPSESGIRMVFYAFLPGCSAGLLCTIAEYDCRRRGGKTSCALVSPLAHCYATDTIQYSLVFKCGP